MGIPRSEGYEPNKQIFDIFKLVAWGQYAEYYNYYKFGRKVPKWDLSRIETRKFYVALYRTVMDNF